MLYILTLIQSVNDAKELLNTKEVTIIGVLLFIIMLLLSALIFIFKKYDSSVKERLQEQKDFTKDLLSITEKTETTIKQINELLKIQR